MCTNCWGSVDGPTPKDVHTLHCRGAGRALSSAPICFVPHPVRSYSAKNDTEPITLRGRPAGRQVRLRRPT
eukprot:scaffold122307_cov30-Phaeocystis_antarctica.AAC.1